MTRRDSQTIEILIASVELNAESLALGFDSLHLVKHFFVKRECKFVGVPMESLNIAAHILPAATAHNL